jgi:hypothetical protein
MRFLLVCCLLLSACADAGNPEDAADDAAAEAAPFAAVSSAKADTFTAYGGLYRSETTRHLNNDITALELRSDSAYVRERCYQPSCTLPLAETDKYDSYTSTSGRTYLRFWSFTTGHDATGNLTETATVADVYEIVKTSTGASLRKTYTSRWFTLATMSYAGQCNASGGQGSTSGCACPSSTTGLIFVPGAGGCIAPAASDESNCDASDGRWSDDDADLTGAYCQCGLNRYVDDTGSCVSI